MWIVTSPPQPQSQFLGGHGAGPWGAPVMRDSNVELHVIISM